MTSWGSSAVRKWAVLLAASVLVGACAAPAGTSSPTAAGTSPAASPSTATASASAEVSYADLKVGIPGPLVTHPFYQDQYKWLKAIAEEDGWGPITIVDSNLNDLKQIQDYEQLAAQGNNAFVLDFLPTAAEGLTTVTAGLPAGSCVIAASAVPITGAQWAIQPHKDGGVAAGKAAAEWVKAHGGKATVFLGRRPDNFPIEQRSVGFKETLLAEVPDAVFAAEAKAIGGTEGAAVVANALQAHPDINVIYQPDDASAFGSLAPLAEAGKTTADQAWVGGFDGNTENLEKIKAGDNPLQFTWSNVNSFLAVSIAREIEKCHRGEDLAPAWKYNGVPTTKENVDQVIKFNSDPFSPEAEEMLKTWITYVDQEFKTGDQYVP